MHLSYAATDEEALAIAHDQWRTQRLRPARLLGPRADEHFDEASRHVPPEAMRDVVLVSSDPERHAAWLRELAGLGFDGLYLHHVGQEQAACIDVFGEHVLPAAGGDGAVRITDTSDLWWKNAVVYCLDVETFLDSDGDGRGDLPGLAQRIDYLAELGVTCLWLMPFYPTPDRDDGYDITDFYGVDARLGTPRRPRRADPHRARPRHAGDRRPRRQPHLGPAPVVPGGALEPDVAATATGTCGATSRRGTRSSR